MRLESLKNTLQIPAIALKRTLIKLILSYITEFFNHGGNNSKVIIISYYYHIITKTIFYSKFLCCHAYLLQYLRGLHIDFGM